MRLRKYIEKTLSLANIQVSNDELTYLEVQVEVIHKAKLPLKNYRLFDVVPAPVFRAEGDKT